MTRLGTLRRPFASQRVDVIPADNSGPDRGDVFTLQLELTFATNSKGRVVTGEELAGMEPTLRRVCTDHGATLTRITQNANNLQLLVDCTPSVPLTKMVRTLRHVANRELRRLQRRGDDGEDPAPSALRRVRRWLHR